MAELIEGHPRFHVLDPNQKTHPSQLEAADELMSVVKRYAPAYFKVKYLAAFTCALLNNQPMGLYSPAVCFSGSITQSSPKSLTILLRETFVPSCRSRVEVGGKQQTEERGARKADRRPQQTRLRGRQGNVPSPTSIPGRSRKA